ncbi:MAG: hypothetical protein PHY73_07155, partial [Candidatus Omnitrophica bacterium]|nr:hypothetical protein [Candidatus Omnitrophota bacterium]
MLTFKRERQGCFCKVVSLLVVATFFTNFIIPVPGFAQTLNILPSPGSLVHLGPVYNPALLTGIQIYPENPLQIDFIVNDGDDNLKGEELKIQAEKMIKYFLASLTTPEEDLWVNLSPYEENRIISDTLAQTDIGRDLLAQDYILKQITASLIYPEDQLGKKFWDKIYKKAYEAYGTTEIPIDTFNKVWIMPDKVAVYEHGNMVFVAEASLKVMLETDYLARQEDRRQKTEDRKDTKTQEHRDTKNTTNLNNPASIVHSPPSDFSKEIIREIVIPELEKEVNQGKNFASLRQVYHSLILAVWFKKTLKKSLLGQIYVDQNKLKGLDLDEQGIKEKIYQQYLEAYKKGAYNYIKPEYDQYTKKNIPRKYFSGGMDIAKEVGSRMILVSFPTIEQERHIAGDDGNTNFQVALSSPMITVDGKEMKIKRMGKGRIIDSDEWVG